MAKPVKTKTDKRPASKIDQLSRELLKEVGDLIREGAPATKIRLHIAEALKGSPAQIPNIEIVRRYMNWELAEIHGAVDSKNRDIKALARSEAEVIRLENLIDVHDIDPSNGNKNLEYLVKLLFHRIGTLRSLQQSELDYRFESLIGSHASKAADIQVKLDGLGTTVDNSEALLERMLGKFFIEFVPLLKDSFLKTAGGGDANAFLDHLNKGRKKIEMDRLRAESIAELTPQKGARNASQSIRVISG